jgi:hypothetical protein
MRWACFAVAPSLGETEEVSVDALRGAALPFVKGPPPAAFFTAADAAREESLHTRSSASGYETLLLPAITVQGLGSVNDAPSATATTHLTVEQYAALCAELAVSPNQAADIHRKYRVVSAAARAALEAAFAQQFRSDPTLHRRWRSLVDHYGVWFRREAPR